LPIRPGDIQQVGEIHGDGLARNCIRRLEGDNERALTMPFARIESGSRRQAFQRQPRGRDWHASVVSGNCGSGIDGDQDRDRFWKSENLIHMRSA